MMILGMSLLHDPLRGVVKRQGKKGRGKTCGFSHFEEGMLSCRFFSSHRRTSAGDVACVVNHGNRTQARVAWCALNEWSEAMQAAVPGSFPHRTHSHRLFYEQTLAITFGVLGSDHFQLFLQLSVCPAVAKSGA